MSEEFWYQKPSNIYKYYYKLKFNNKMLLDESLNVLSRIIIIVFIILALVFRDISLLVIMLIILFIIVIVHYILLYINFDSSNRTRTKASTNEFQNNQKEYFTVGPKDMRNYDITNMQDIHSDNSLSMSNSNNSSGSYTANTGMTTSFNDMLTSNGDISYLDLKSLDNGMSLGSLVTDGNFSDAIIGNVHEYNADSDTINNDLDKGAIKKMRDDMFKTCDEIYDIKNFERTFKTQPNNNIPSGQGEAMKWIYATPVTGKEYTGVCKTYDDLSIKRSPITNMK